LFLLCSWRRLDLGVEFRQINSLAPGAFVVSKKIEGSVVAISADGNLITDIGAADLKNAPRDASVTVTCDGYDTQGILPQNHDQPAGTMVAFLDEEERLQFAIVGDSISAMLGVKSGAQVTVQW